MVQSRKYRGLGCTSIPRQRSHISSRKGYHGRLVRQRYILVHDPPSSHIFILNFILLVIFIRQLPSVASRHLPRRNRPTSRLVPILPPNLSLNAIHFPLQNPHNTRFRPRQRPRKNVKIPWQRHLPERNRPGTQRRKVERRGRWSKNVGCTK